MTANWTPGSGYSRAMGEYVKWYRSRLQPSGKVEDEEFVAAKLANNFLLGCDPEFVVLQGDTAINTQFVLKKEGVVGYDHSGHVVELRPEPAKGTYMLVKRMKKLLDENPGLLRLAKYQFRAGALVKAKVQGADNMAVRGERILTLGGHVHIDHPPKQGDIEFDNVVEALDRLTKHLEGLDILCREESTARRNDPGARKNRYGQWGDWRNAGDHNERCEYRVMASWLFHPHVAYLCLTGAKLCASSPLLATEILRSQVSFERFKAFFEAFRHRDSNARRALEKLFDGRDVKYLQHDPTVDFKTTWKDLGL